MGQYSIRVSIYAGGFFVEIAGNFVVLERLGNLLQNSKEVSTALLKTLIFGDRNMLKLLL